MKCPVCGYEMRPLFIHCVCDRCDGKIEETLHEGWIAYHRNQSASYVFRTKSDAEKWRSVRGFGSDAPVKRVLMLEPPRWQPSRGTVIGLELADVQYEIYATRSEMYRSAARNRAVLADT